MSDNVPTFKVNIGAGDKKALILVGGFGTRLRPMTLSVPKPLVEFANKPISLHQIEALVEVGVKVIILAVNYKPKLMMDYLKECEEKFQITIVCSLEEEPLGTGGPVALARKYLTANDQPFFMFNSDVIAAYPLKEMLAFHKDHGKEGTLMVTPVKDPSKYGVVLSDERGCISAFIEKPTEYVSNLINAGMYLFNPSVCDRIEERPTSIEREIFPKMASDSQLYSMVLPGYWMDVGQPKDFIAGTRLHLAHLSEKKMLGNVPEHVQVQGHVLVDSSATFGANCVIGPDVVIGADVVVGDGVRVINSTVFRGARLNSHSFVKNSLVGWESKIGSWAHCSDCVLGEDVNIAKEIAAHKLIVCPHKSVKSDSVQGGIIL